MKLKLAICLTLAIPSLAGAQALSGQLADLDAATLKELRARIGCDRPRSANTKLACDGLAAFARGGTPDTKHLDGVRLIGTGISIDAKGAVSPKLELLAFIYERTRNFHEAVELGDQVTEVPVEPENAAEAKAVQEAAAAVASGKTPSGNGAYDFARTMSLSSKLVRTRGTNGSSLGMAGRNRMLIRQDGHTLVILELTFQNTHVAGHPLWVDIFRIR